MRNLIAGAILGFAALAAGSAFSADGPVDSSKVRKDLTSAATGKTYKIATVVKVDGIAWFERMRDGVAQFGKETGHDTWLVGPSHSDAAEQVELIENLIAQGVDAICLVPIAGDALEPVLRKARDRGIVVISHEGSDLKNVDYDIEAFDNKAYGEAQMKELAKLMGEEGEYLTTVGTLGSRSHMEWVDAEVAYQKAHYPKMKEVADRIELYDDTGYDKMREAQVAHPALKGAIGASMPSAAGAGQFVAERNLGGKFFFVGTSLVSVAGKYLKDGDVSYIQFWDPADAGYVMNELAVLALNNKRGEIKPGLDLGVPGYNSLTAPAQPNMLFGAGWVGVTKENMDKYPF
jgi:simple sugar transport system substrate-binding protein